jgi:hypothetical protein
VGESYVTDEVREDLFNLGWIVVNEDQDNWPMLSTTKIGMAITL